MSPAPYSSSSSTSYLTVFEPPPHPSSCSSATSTSTSTFLPPFPSSSSSASSTQPPKPARLPRTISDMDISSESDDDTRREEEELIEGGQEETKEEEQDEEERRVEPLLAAKLASALLGSVLFTKGQIPTTIQQLTKQASSTSRSSTPTPLPKRPSYLPSRPQPSTLLLPLLESFNTSLQRAFKTLAALSSVPPPPSPAPSATSLATPPPTSTSPTSGPTLMFLHGPSLLLPKALFGVQLPPFLPDDANEHEKEESVEAKRERVQRWDTIERAVLRGLVMLRSMSSSSSSRGGDGLAPGKTHLLLLAPRSFLCPSGLWLPRATLSPRLSSLLFTPPPPAPPPLLNRSRMKQVEFIRIRVDTGAAAGGNGVGVEDGHERGEAGGGDEEGELIWFVWEGGTVEGWKEK